MAVANIYIHPKTLKPVDYIVIAGTSSELLKVNNPKQI